MLRLQRLELHGFKSFADRTVMDFADHALTGIVGPNGCGKSNVVDAVRWVLGETRPTSMRGSGMTDVIFKGSASRPGMGLAEVTVVLDNSGGELEGRGVEVAVTRRLYKSGEGEYLIDGAKVRLKDVRDLLFNTGLGSRGYSVLEQGRIDAVLSANPVQRRAIFEEAAGISRYRQRRHEAELRLARVEQDVERLDDLMGELRSRVRSLKIQAGKAERYVTLKGEWTEGRARFLVHRLVQTDRRLAALGPVIGDLEQSVGELREERSACEAQVVQVEQERSAVVAELDRVSTEAGRVEGEVRALAERREQLAMRIASWEASSAEEASRAEELSVQLGEQRGELEAMAAQVSALRTSAEEAAQRAESLAIELKELDKQYQAARKTEEEQNERVLAALHERSAAQNRVVHLEEAQEPAGERVERMRAQAAAAVEAATEAEQRVRSAQAATAAATAAFGVAEARCAESGAAVEAGEERRVELDGRRKQLEVEQAGLEARRQALEDRERQLEELSDGTRKLIEAVESGAGPCDEDGLRGVVADHLHIDTRLARALDAALGERSTTLVVRDAHVARRVVDWAQDSEAGQVAVVVPPGLGAPECPAPSDYALFARYGNGVEGRLCDLLRCSPDMRPMARALCCDTVVVADLDLALSLIAENPRWRFVTPRGELVDAAGVRGGFREITQGAVGRRAQAQDLGRQVQRLDAELTALAAEDEACNVELAEARGVQRAAQGERDGAREALATAEGQVRAALQRRDDLTQSLEGRQQEVGRAEAELASLREEFAQAQAARAAAEEHFQTQNARLAELDGARLALEAQRDALAKERGRAELARTQASSELSGLEERIESEERRIERDDAEVTRARGRAENFAENAVAGQRQSVELEGRAGELGAERATLEAGLDELREKERSGAARSTEVRKIAEAVQQRMDGAGELLSERRLEQQREGLAREEVLGRASEELALEPHQLLESQEIDEELMEDDDSLRELESSVATCKAQLDKLGPVNVEAVHELEEVEGRLDHLDTQATDLAEARKSLAETIRQIDEESRRRFIETFEEVRGNFQRIFRQLFGGGKADVQLEPDKDVLEAGIEIQARPPGREMLSIGLLSGGQRTMTALALLFAVFEARPSPFCVLDEVDAALDDANVDRFLGMLEGFQKSTQFIVVTHNKGSMSACDALYGVTMQVKGVSRYVAVELDQVDEFAPETTGGAKGQKPGKNQGRATDPESGEPVVELVPGAQVANPEEPAEAPQGS